MDNNNNYNEEYNNQECNHQEYNQEYNHDYNQVISVGGWILTLIVASIPVINIIMLIIWALGTGGNENRKNYAIAQLILTLISIVIMSGVYYVMFDLLSSSGIF